MEHYLHCIAAVELDSKGISFVRLVQLSCVRSPCKFDKSKKYDMKQYYSQVPTHFGPVLQLLTRLLSEVTPTVWFCSGSVTRSVQTSREKQRKLKCQRCSTAFHQRC